MTHQRCRKFPVVLSSGSVSKVLLSNRSTVFADQVTRPGGARAKRLRASVKLRSWLHLSTTKIMKLLSPFELTERHSYLTCSA